MKIFSSQQIYEADKQTILNQGIESSELMERAATTLFHWLTNYLQTTKKTISVSCGIGNNGGDALIVAKLLIESGYTVQTYVVNLSANRSKDFLWAYDEFTKSTKSNPIVLSEGDNFPSLEENEFLIDGIFGIGLNRSITGWVKDLVHHINQSNTYILSIDIPSGLFANAPNSDSDAIICANHTLSFQAPKLAFFLPENSPYVSSFEILDIGLDQKYLDKTETTVVLTTEKTAKSLYKPPHRFDHKGNNGHALIVGGSYGKIGATVLSTKACLHTGAGLVTCFTPKCGYTIMQSTIPEAMVLTDINEKVISEISLDFIPSAIAIGMGMGQDSKSKTALLNLFKTSKCPMLIDADALNLIATHKDLEKTIPKNSVLTPHPGELKRLIGDWENDYDKLEKAKQFSKNHKVVLIIKGAYTTIVKGEKLFINTTGNPGMATAGSGDVLSGVIAALLAQNYNSLNASILGVYIHGKAGDFALKKKGFESLIAGDIIDHLGKAFIALYSSDNFPIPKNII